MQNVKELTQLEALTRLLLGDTIYASNNETAHRAQIINNKMQCCYKSGSTYGDIAPSASYHFWFVLHPDRHQIKFYDGDFTEKETDLPEAIQEKIDKGDFGCQKSNIEELVGAILKGIKK